MINFFVETERVALQRSLEAWPIGFYCDADTIDNIGCALVKYPHFTVYLLCLSV